VKIAPLNSATTAKDKNVVGIIVKVGMAVKKDPHGNSK
jgi:hypothetical protein